MTARARWIRAGRLRLTLYLGAVVLAFLIGGIYLALRSAQPFGRHALTVATGHVVASLASWHDDPDELRAQLAQLGGQLELSLYDGGGHLLAVSGDHALALPATEPTAAPPPQDGIVSAPPDSASASADDRDRLVIHRIYQGGELVMSAVLDLSAPPRPAALRALVVLSATMVLLVVVLVRMVGGPMQRIAEAARRFGRGDLSARAGLSRKDELGEVGRAFDGMAERVTWMMTAQRELMANVSHELQTPLARVQVAVDLMLDGVSDRVKELLPEISGDLAEVERLIEDVMTLARFDLAHAEGRQVSTPLRSEWFEMAEVVERAATRFRNQHPGRALDVRVMPGLPELWGDPMLVRRVVDNLLDNSRKYSEAETVITLRVDRAGEALRVEIADRGIGIDQTDLKRVFTPFFRTDRSRSRATGGVGLGMVLARRIVEAHGGTIAVQSEPNRGTSVTFELPVGEPPEALASGPRPSAPSWLPGAPVRG